MLGHPYAVFKVRTDEPFITEMKAKPRGRAFETRARRGRRTRRSGFRENRRGKLHRSVQDSAPDQLHGTLFVRRKIRRHQYADETDDPILAEALGTIGIKKGVRE